jgi:hypothetical protein
MAVLSAAIEHLENSQMQQLRGRQRMTDWGIPRLFIPVEVMVTTVLHLRYSPTPTIFVMNTSGRRK